MRHRSKPVHSSRHDAFGRAVFETRARRGLSQEQLGFRCRLHRNYVGAIERGEINPTLRVLFKLEAGLGLPAWELLRLGDERHAEMPLSSVDPPSGPRNDTTGGRR